MNWDTIVIGSGPGGLTATCIGDPHPGRGVRGPRAAGGLA